MKTLCTLFLLCLSASSTSVWATGKHLERLYGYAYDLETGAYLYTEVHAQMIDARHWYHGAIDYYTPEGMKIGRKTLNFAYSPSLPIFRMEDFRAGYIEGINAISDDTVTEFKRVTHGAAMQTDTVARSEPMAADAGFHMLIYNQFDALMKGETLSFHLAVPGRLSAYRFRVRKVGDAPYDGKPAVQLIVEPDSLLRWLVDPLNLTYDPKTRKMLEYRGISNLFDPATGKNYVVRTIFPEHRPADAPKHLPPLRATRDRAP